MSVPAKSALPKTSIVVESLQGRDLLSLADLTPEEFSGLLESALTLKQAWKNGDRPKLLEHKTLAMIFRKTVAPYPLDL